jgi:broad specificity phosphatase PhoE
MKTHLYICRHGNTFMPGEAPRRVGGRTDLPLVASGHAQAKVLGDHFKSNGVKPVAFFTGPLQRTVDTALAILEATAPQAALQIDLRLREIDYGPDENQLEPIVRQRIGEHSINAWESEGIPPEGWQVDPKALMASWRSIGEEILQTFPGRDVVIVTSNGIARFACGLLGGMDFLKNNGGMKLRTGAYGLLTHTPAAGWALEAWDVRPDEAR